MEATSNKIFQNVVADVVTVNGTLNGYRPSQFFTLSTDQVIEGHINFADGITVKGDLTISSAMLDRVNLTGLVEGINRVSSSDNWKYDVEFIKPVKAEGLKMLGSLNNYEPSILAKDFIYDSDEETLLTSKKTFKAKVKVGDLNVQRLNGVDISKFLRLDIPQTLSNKQFIGTTTFSNLEVTGRVDGHDLDAILSNHLSLGDDGFLTGTKNFTGMIKAKNLTVLGMVNNVNFKNVLKTSGDQTIEAPMRFKEVSFKNISASNTHLLKNSTLNYHNFEGWCRDRVTLKGDSVLETIMVDKAVVNGFLEAIRVNGVLLSDMENNILMKHEDATIKANMVADRLEISGDLSTCEKRGIGRHNISGIYSKALKLNEDNWTPGHMVWNNVELHNKIERINNDPIMIDGFNLQALVDDAVMKSDKSIKISGTKHFLHGFSVTGDLEAATVGGVNLAKDMLVTSKPQEILLGAHFGNIKVEKKMEIQGYFNAFNLTDFDKSTYEEVEYIPGDAAFEGNVRIGGMKFSGKINKMNMALRLQKAVRLNKNLTAITGEKIFMSPTFSEIEIERLNKKDFRGFINRALRTDSSRILFGPLQVTGHVEAPSLVTYNLTVTDTIDSVLPGNLFSDAVYVDEDSNLKGKLILAHNVSVHGDIAAGRVNDANLREDFMMTNHEQTIKSAVFLSVVARNVSVLGHINSQDLVSLLQKSLKDSGNQIITGQKTFNGPVTVIKNLTLSGRVGTNRSIDIVEDTIKLDENNTVEGGLMVLAPLRASSIRCGTGIVNDVDLQELNRTTWFKNEPTNLSQPIDFRGPLTFKEGATLSGEGATISGEGATLSQGSRLLSISNLRLASGGLLETFQKLLEGWKGNFTESCKRTSALYNKLENALYEPNYFSHVCNFTLPGKVVASASYRLSSETQLVLTLDGNTCNTIFMRWTAESVFQTVTAFEECYTDIKLIHVESLKAIILFTGTRSSNIYEVTNVTQTKVADLDSGLYSTVDKRSNEYIIRIHNKIGTREFLYNFESRTTEPFGQTDVTAPDFETSFMNGTAFVKAFVQDKNKVILVDETGEFTFPVGSKSKVIDLRLLALQSHLLFTVSLLYEGLEDDRFFVLIVGYSPSRKFYVHDLFESGSPAKLMPLYVKNANTRNTFLCVLQEDGLPEIFEVRGDSLVKLWGEIPLPGVSWLQQFEVVSETGAFTDDYVFFSVADGSAVVARLEMLGQKLPPRDVNCKL